MKSRIQSAAGRWAELSASLNEDSLDELEAIERTILNSRPSTTLDAIVILDVVAAGISGGERSDGLDAKAIKSVSRLLRTSAQLASPPPHERRSSAGTSPARA